MLQTWQTADCSQQKPYNGDFEAAMRGIKAKTLTLPSKTDLYFPYARRIATLALYGADNVSAGLRTQSMKLPR